MPVYVFRQTHLHTGGLASGPRLALFLRRSPAQCLHRASTQLQMPSQSLSLSLVFSTSPVFNLTYNAAATSHHSLSLGKKLRPEGKEAWREIATLNIPSTCVTASSPQYHLRPSQNTDSRHPPRMIQT